MKKFRFFSLIAIIAAFSTVFAAWQYVNYANEYASDPASLGLSVDMSELEAISVLDITIDNASDVTIAFAQSEDMPNIAVANVSDDINITVTEAEDGAIAKYDFYYAIYGGGSSAEGTFQKLGSLKQLSEYEPNGAVDYAKLTVLEVDADGKAVISKDAIAGLLEHEIAAEGVDIDNFEAALEAFKAKVQSGSVLVKIYAKKAA